MRNNKGMTIPIILIIMAIMMTLGYAGFTMVETSSKSNIISDDSQKAMKYAEAGYNKYLWHLNDDLNFYITETHDKMMNKAIAFEDGYFMLDVTKPSDSDRFVTIKSTGWTKENPDIRKTISVRIRKKQFVHHVYVSNNDGEIWWTTGDESHGPYHTNGNMNIQNIPKFYDIVTYKGILNSGSGYKPEFYIDKTTAYVPKTTDKNLSYLYKTSELGFPQSNKDLHDWAKKDNLVFYGRTCIFLDGDKVYIRNQNEDKATEYSISNIPNKVIYVSTNYINDKDRNKNTSYGKFDFKSGNVFVSGKLEGKLTIGAEDKIYITYDDPTNWYDYSQADIKNYNGNKPPNQPPTSEPDSGGIEYTNTYFSGNKSGTGTAMSSFDSEKKIWTRYSFDKRDKNKPGKDMLGLIANNEILILHYGWPKKAYASNLSDNSWDFEWNKFKNGKWETKTKEYDVAPKDITINAAIFSVKAGFGYEDYNKGVRKGDIKLWGNITQFQRKAVGTIETTGYNKKYAHDPRMFYDYPPHILEPTNVGWEIHEWKEINEHVIEKP